MELRVIKFRGKRLDNGEWVYGHYSDFNHNPDGLPKMTYWINVPVGGYQHEVDPATVGQFTGLKDWTGKDVYEGDIIECKQINSSNERGWIIFISGTFFLQIRVEDGLPLGYPLHDIERFEKTISLRTEVHGNIHDNPELLKTE